MSSMETDGQRDYISYNKKMHDYSPATKKILDLVASYIPDAEKAYQNSDYDGIHYNNMFRIFCSISNLSKLKVKELKTYGKF